MRHQEPRGAGELPSARYLALGRASSRELEETLLRGHCPDPASLAGWEFRGMNRPEWARLVGIKKFIKGFFLRDGAVHGYNTPVVQNKLTERWIARPSESRPRRFGFYRVTPVEASSRDNRYLHALLLDYGRGGNHRLDPTAGLRDYLVQVDRDNPDLYLGKAYYALGPVRVSTSFFVLERLREGLPAS